MPETAYAVAIVSAGGIFPEAASPTELWQLVNRGRSAAREVPPGRWHVPAEAAYDPAVGRPDHVYSRHGCFVDTAAVQVDPARLQLPAGLLPQLDPAFHLLLHAGLQAWDTARTAGLDRERVGVICGNLALPSESSSALARQVLGPRFEQALLGGDAGTFGGAVHPLNRQVAGLPAAVLARALGLGGPHYTLDAACASSLYAVKLACDALSDGRLDAVLAGGLSRPDPLYTQMGFSQLRALSPTGVCAPFDRRGNGLVVGEGCGLFLLKRLADAERDGDAILGVIRAVGLSNDVGGSLLAPLSEGQLRAMRAAYRQAGWEPWSVGHIECHATGTPVGDAVEFASLQELWREAPADRQGVIGSVKSNIGHLLTAAGAAALTKTLFALNEGVCPPTAGFAAAGDNIPLAASPFRVLTQAEGWAEADRPRRAAVSAFGFGGINAHLLLEAYRPQATASADVRQLPNHEPIAVVGLEVRLAPDNDPTADRQRLLTGTGGDGRFERLAVEPGRFRIPPKELEEMLPQQLLMLQAAAGALADAGPCDADPLRTGVGIGIAFDLASTGFSLRWSLTNVVESWAWQLGVELTPAQRQQWLDGLRAASGPPLTANRVMGALGNIVASRIAREFGFGGPAHTFSSEETSLLPALDAAVGALRRGELDRALVGSVDLPGDPRTTPEGPVQEGAAALVLMRLADARRQGMKVYGLVEEVVYTSHAPHGTCTSYGPHASHEPLWAPAGALTGGLAVTGALLALQRQLRPGAAGPRYWLANADELPRRATVTVAAAEGGSGCVTLLEAPEDCAHQAEAPSASPWPEALFALSGDDVAALLASLAQLRRQAIAAPASLAHLAGDWCRRQSAPGRLTAALVADTPERLLQQLDLLEGHLRQQPELPLGGRDTLLPACARDRVFYRPEPLAPAGETAFLYPGMGNPFAGVGAAVAARFPRLLRQQEGENRRLRDQYRTETFWREDGTLPTDDQNALVIGQVAYGTLITDLLRDLGMVPQAAIGYSLGESTALFANRAWPDRDGMLERLERSPLFVDELAGPCRAAARTWELAEGEDVDWLTAVINRPAAAISERLAEFSRAYLLIVNTPDECVIGGERAQVEALARAVDGHLFPLAGVSTVHCPVVRTVADPYRELHRFDTRAAKGLRFYSGASGSAYIPERESAAAAILAQAVDTVDYTRVIEQAWQDGVRLFVEIGPGNSCSRMVGRILAGRPHLARSASVPGQSEEAALLRLLAELLAEGVPVEPERLFPAVALPATPAGIAVERPRTHFAPPRPPVAAPTPASPPATAPPAAAAVGAEVPPEVALLQALTAEQAKAHELFLQTMQQLQQTMALGLQQLGQAPAAVVPPSPAAKPLFDYGQCLEFAIGKVANMLGPEFAPVDTYPSRVRLPDEPLQLVHRITELEGTPRSMGSGRVVTEHDVAADAWYLDGGRAPVCISVEAGQADLFLSGYLGIDFQHRGQAVYRLLDATVTFHRELPRPGETIRYDIHIDHFFRQGDTWLFRFWFDGTIDGVPFITMRNGCAGFFTAAELAAGKGIVHTRLDLREEPGKRPDDWREPVPLASESYDEAQLDALRAGDLAGCFGPRFAGLPLQQPLTLPGGRMRLVHRILAVEPGGGRFGLGRIRGEADIRPDDWFLTCHFCDDHVMPGTLMYECCQHTLRVLLLRLGWVTDAPGAAWQPVPEVGNQLKCRGQVTESTRKVEYVLTLKEIGYRPEPYAITDALMLADGKPVVEVLNLSVMLTGTDRTALERLWTGREEAGIGPRPAIFDTDRITAFAVGKPSDAFGEPYRVFDGERRIARLPGPPFQFLDRITAIRAEPWVMQAGGRIEAQYDVPPDAWYFDANRCATMPFCVLLETALQPCGWLAAYLGSALTSDTDLSFRNLDGHAVQLREVTPDSGTLTTQVTITKVARSGGMIIQSYDFELSDRQGPVYQGDTVFGFFPGEALANQVGVRDAQPWAPEAAAVAQGRALDYPADAPFPDAKLRMIDRIPLWLPDGGPAGLGFLRGEMDVDPSAWFFQAHFYQDPVVPGSLGLESLLQLLKVAAAQRWGVTADNRFETVALGRPQRWNYRGQVVPANRLVTVEACITAVDDEQRLLTADGWLQVDGKIIYKMQDFTLRLR